MNRSESELPSYHPEAVSFDVLIFFSFYFFYTPMITISFYLFIFFIKERHFIIPYTVTFDGVECL